MDIKSIENLIFDYFIQSKINNNLKKLEDHWEKIIPMKFQDFKENEKYKKENKFIRSVCKKIGKIYFIIFH